MKIIIWKIKINLENMTFLLILKILKIIECHYTNQKNKGKHKRKHLDLENELTEFINIFKKKSNLLFIKLIYM